MSEKVLETDEAVIAFTVDLLKDEDFMNKFSYHLDQRGIDENTILNSVEINANEKILLLKKIKEETKS